MKRKPFVRNVIAAMMAVVMLITVISALPETAEAAQPAIDSFTDTYRNSYSSYYDKLMEAKAGHTSGADRMVAIAKSQVELTYPEMAYWCFGVNAGWCNAFIAWCGYQAGYTDGNIIAGSDRSMRDGYYSYGIDKMISMYTGWGVYTSYSRTGYVSDVKRGDIIFCEGSAHVALVESVSGDTINCIDGNWSNSVKATVRYKDNSRNTGVNTKITGVARPKYCVHDYGDTGYCSKCKTWAPFTDTSARTGIYKVKSGKTAHFRTQPYGAASEIQQLSAGTQFNVTGAVKNYFNNLWYKVSYNGKTGYIVDTNVEFYKNVTYPITISPAQTSYTIKQGSVCNVTGSITSEGIITRVTATLDGSKYVDYNPNSTSVNIGDSSAGRINSFRAQDLSVGTHYLVIGAENATMCYSKTITITVTGSSTTVYPITISPAQTSYTIKQGNICSVTGSITSSAKITRVTASLDGSKYVDYNPNATSVNIGDSSAGRINSFRAQDLSVGTHSLVIYAENSTTNATKTITITVTGTSSTSYTDEIGHWAWGFQNQEGNNHNKKGFKIGETTFSKVSGSSFTLSGGDAITIPNGYYLDKVIGTSSVTGSWQAFDMPSTFSQKSYVMHFQYDYYPITYNITYVLNGGTNHADNPSTYNVLYGVTFKEPTRSGYSFAGWTTNGSSIKGINVGKNAAFSSENDLYVQLSSRMTGDLTVTANWKKKETGKVLPFTDVTKSKSYYDAVYWAYFAGIVKGKSETRFAPGDSLTRGEFCTMLWRMFGKQSVDGLTCPFADAKKSNHYKAILWCYNQGIINGYKVDGKQVFKPGNTITRGNIIVMLFKLAKQEKSYKPATIKNPYTDVKSTNKNISAYKWAYENGVTTAKKLSPSTACKRSAMVSFLYGYNNTYKVVK